MLKSRAQRFRSFSVALSVKRTLTDSGPPDAYVGCCAQKPLVADRVHETQIHRQSHDAHAERRARLQALRHRRKRRAAAAPAAARIALHPRHHGRDLGQVDLVVAPVQNMVRLAERRLAVRAPHRLGADDLVGGLSQCPSAPHAAQTSWARATACHLGSSVRLLAL